MKHNLFGHLIGTNNILSTNTLLIRFTGSHDKAIYLSQLIYWSARSRRKDGFFAKSYSQWDNEILVKEQSIRRFTKKFVEMGFLETKIHKFNNIPTLHYKLHIDLLEKMLIEFLENEEKEESQNTENQPLSNCQGTPIKLSDQPLSNCQGTPIKLSDSINIDYNKEYNKDYNTERERDKEEIETSQHNKPAYFKQPDLDFEKFPWERATDFLMEKFKTHQTTRSQIKSAKDSTEWKGTVKDFRKLAESLFRDAENNREKYGRLLILPDNEEKYWAWLSKVMARLKTFMEFRVRDQKKDEPKKMKYDRVLK